MKLTKVELINTIYQKVGTSKATATAIFDALVSELREGLVRGDSVELRNLFVLKTKTTPERIGVNPKTGEKITLPAHRIIQVKLSPKLKKAVW